MNLQIAYNHKTRFGILDGIKISQNSYLENGILKFARRWDCKSLIYLNLYKNKWVLARKFILT